MRNSPRQKDMKSEHRHELQTNDLGKLAKKGAHYIDQHGNRLMTIISVSAVVLAIGIYVFRSRANERNNASIELSMALANGKPEVLHDVWNRYQNTVSGYWALVHEGEARLKEGVEGTFRNLDRGTEDVKKAQEAFQLVVSASGVPKDIRERALIGLARAQESNPEGKEGDAVKSYELFVKEFPRSIYLSDAESRISVLKGEKGREFYSWFAKYTRPVIEEKRPRDSGTADDSAGVNQLIDFGLDKPAKKGKGKSSEDGEDLTIPDPSESRENAPKLKEKPDFAEPEAEGDKPAQPETKPEVPDEAPVKPDADAPKSEAKPEE